ncbi:STAS domain-containing protein [Frankia sp. EI5c]|uniref:STAS domain-containing protein n=1 Tax=Frankia sp. EI5c TaxID=683316 RepID=UPI0007C40A2F|nr:STAS domain-containing protein [Frankia sp. EI5c]OAA25183.1 STAS domain-containing protein [Frankia sp. EI5c]
MTLTIGKEADTDSAGSAAPPRPGLAASALVRTPLPPAASIPTPIPTPVAVPAVLPVPALTPGRSPSVPPAAGPRLTPAPPGLAGAGPVATGPWQPARPLATRIEPRPEGAVIHLSGLLVSSAVRSARIAVEQAASLGSPEILVDLTDVWDADPLGAVLLGAMSRHAARHGCRLRLRNAGRRVRRALEERGVHVELLEPTG